MLTERTLRRLETVLVRDGFESFIDAVGRMVPANQRILAVIGAVALLEHSDRLTVSAALNLAAWGEQFRDRHVGGT